MTRVTPIDLADAPLTVTLALQPPTSDAWGRFAYELSEGLRALEEDEFLIVSIKRRNQFVQFACQGSFGMRAEAASNFYLPEGQSLNDADHLALLSMGWHAPTNLPDPLEPGGHKPDGSANYFVDAAQPVEHEALALLAVETLSRVFGAEHPGNLEYTAFSEEHVSIRFPALGIRRRPA